VSDIISLSKEKNVPYIFSGNRFILGKAIMQIKTPISAIAIFNYQSVEVCSDLFEMVLYYLYMLYNFMKYFVICRNCLVRLSRQLESYGRVIRKHSRKSWIKC